jgi:uncharacterized protein
MSQENVEVIRRAFEASNRDGPEAALAGLAPDLEWPDLPDQPDAGVHHGHTGFLAANEQFFGELEDYRLLVDETIDLGNQVTACIRVIGRGRGSGATFEQRTAGVWTLRNGSIVRVAMFGTREDALEAAGLSE